MLFKDCKQGVPVYILDRKLISVTIGKVTNNPFPHFDSKCPSKMVVDVNVDINGGVTAYVLDDSSEVGYVGNLVITCNRETIAREIECLKSQSEEALRMADWNKECVEKCCELLKEYSNEYKERSEYTERIQGVESKVDRLTDSLTALIEKLEKKGGLI